jgi:chemotaxis family two-component system response regulator Rcp1
MTEEDAAPKIHILLVEDNPGDIQLLRMALDAANLDWDLTVANDGRDALDFVQRRGKHVHAVLPELAVLDLNLPKNDGLDVLEAIRANPALAGIPVVILSSSSSPRDKLRVDRFQVSRFIAKPADLDEYLAIGWTLKEILAESRSRAGK